MPKISEDAYVEFVVEAILKILPDSDSRASAVLDMVRERRFGALTVARLSLVRSSDLPTVAPRKASA
jgi:hypothetical protein